MVHLEPISPDNLLPPKFISGPASKIRGDDVEACPDDPDLAKIARRFAPGLVAAGPSQDYRLRYRAERTLSKLFSPGIRALFAAIIVLTASPGPAFEGFNWLALVEALPAKPDSAHPSQNLSQSAVVAAVAKPFSGLSSPTVTTPGLLEGEAGKEIDFRIALLRAFTLPARSIVAVSGLPSNSRFSSGRPYGEDEWNLRIDEIDNLRLVLPPMASGESKLTVQLLAPNGETIASAETVLRVLSHSRPASASAPGFTFIPVSSGFDADGIPAEMQVEPPWLDDVQESQSAGVMASQDSGGQTQPVNKAPAPSIEGQSGSRVELSDFVNLRKGPSSSARIIGRLDKGSRVRVLDRKRGWLQVAGSGTSVTGWVYSRYALRPTESQTAPKKLASSRAEPSRVGPKSDDGFWTRMGRWLTGK